MSPRKTKVEQSDHMSEDDIAKLTIAEQTIKNSYHIQTLNSEMGQTRDLVSVVTKDVGDVKVSLGKVHSDLGWIKKIGYVVGLSSLGALARMLFH